MSWEFGSINLRLEGVEEDYPIYVDKKGYLKIKR